MKKKINIKLIFYSPYFLSFLLTIVLIFFLPPLFSKYEIKLVEQGEVEGNDEIIYYNDLDGDGNSEMIYSMMATSNGPHHAIQVFNHHGGIYDQWNLKGGIAGCGERIAFGDINDDGLKEAVTFSVAGDSILLSIFKPVEKGEFLIKNRFIAHINPTVLKKSYSIQSANLVDIDGDTIKEIIFSINSGTFSPERSVYIYWPYKDSLIHSPYSASNVRELNFIDLNNDGKPEITGSTTACGNSPDTANKQFTDYSAWLMVFDHQLNFLFPPVEFPGFRMRVRTYPFSEDGKNLILALVNNALGTTKTIPELFLYDYSGRQVQSEKLPIASQNECNIYMDTTAFPVAYYIFTQSGQVFRLNNDLKVKKVKDIEYQIDPRPLLVADFDDDGKTEYLFLLDNKKGLALYRHNFSNPVLIPFSKKNDIIINTSIIRQSEDGKKSNLLFVQTGDKYFKYRYGFNNLSLFQYPIYLGIYLLVLLFIMLIRKLFQLQMEEKMTIQASITEMQLKTVNNQLNPHFTFNVFNAIATLLIKEKGKVAYDYFMKFSKLVRANLLSADKISRTLDEELSIVRDYLDLQQLRFDNRFDYEITVDEHVNLKTEIPKMIIQNYVENAVKHGIKHLPEGGFITVKAEKQHKTLKLTIQDNGIGRKRASEKKSDSTGMGMMVMKNYFELLNRFNAVKIKQNVIDLYDEAGESAGTKVIIELPDNINFNLYHGIK